MPGSLNTQIADALTARQIQTARVESAQRRQVWAILALLEADLLAALRLSDPTEPTLLARRRRRVERLLAEEMAPLIASRYASIAALTTVALVRLARNEATAMTTVVNTLTGEETLPEAVPLGILRTAVEDTAIPTVSTATDLSATGADWWERMGAGVEQRIGDQLLVSVGLEETLAEATARLQGTAEKAFTDGVMARARQDAARLVRTEVTNAVSEARVAVVEANSPQVEAIRHTSILDNRTSTICQARDGLLFTGDTHEPIGHDIPYLSGIPYHWGCRSSFTPIIQGGGPVDGGGFEAFLRRKGAEFQDEALGTTRAQLWRAGQIPSLRDLLDAATGQPLSLAALEEASTQ